MPDHTPMTHALLPIVTRYECEPEYTPGATATSNCARSWRFLTACINHSITVRGPTGRTWWKASAVLNSVVV